MNENVEGKKRKKENSKNESRKKKGKLVEE